MGTSTRARCKTSGYTRRRSHKGSPATPTYTAYMDLYALFNRAQKKCITSLVTQLLPLPFEQRKRRWEGLGHETTPAPPVLCSLYLLLLCASIPCSQVSALAGDAAASALTPISGYLSFPDQSGASRVIQLSSKDDDLPEPSQLFTVRLGTSDGGSRIALGEDSASLTGET